MLFKAVGSEDNMFKSIVLVLSFTLCFMACSKLEASGLKTTFGEVKIEDLQTGKASSIKEASGLLLEVINTGHEPIDLKMEVILPENSELKQGYEAIPDISWLKLDKTEFKAVKPNESAITDIVISVPNDEVYSGKNYQVFIWSHSTGKGVGVGLKSKLLLSIAKDKNNK